MDVEYLNGFKIEKSFTGSFSVILQILQLKYAKEDKRGLQLE